MVEQGRKHSIKVYRDWPIIPPPQPRKPTQAETLWRECVDEMEAELSLRHPAARRSALERLASLNIPPVDSVDNVNLHTHTFFSYNASGWSPSRFAWEAYKAGLYASGIIDFDVLDGAREFVEACELLGIRGTSGIEVRGFLPEFAGKVIDSPGEPGVHYVAGSGMFKSPAAGSPDEAYLLRLRSTAEDRNRALVARINENLADLAIDYDKDVVPLTIGGNATERHIVNAYILASEAAFPDPVRWVSWWSSVLRLPTDVVILISADRPKFEEAVRGRFAKRGGIGYRQPDESTFPPVGEVYAWIRRCGGVPMDSWLDGTSEGESLDVERMECNRSLGALALNLIPDRNWNVQEPDQKLRKLAKLAEVVSLAKAFHMPIHIGTEGNKAGLPFVDDLSRPELAPFKRDFIAGAQVLVGHAVLARYADFPYAGPEAEGEFGRDFKARNEFFGAVGRLPAVDSRLAWYFSQVGPRLALDAIRSSVRSGEWKTARIPR